MLRTALTDLLQIEHPILQGGMAWVATAELVAAVSNGGGLGILGAGNAPPGWVREQLQRIRAGTSRPYGVNVPLFSPYLDDIVRLCAQEQVPVMTTGAGNPAPWIAPLKERGVKVIPVVASAALAQRLVRAGADAVIAEGEEAGGHIGTVTTLALVPQVVDAVSVPVIAAGGIADGRGLAAALALGAAGIQMGTRFVCTDECAAHEHYKQALVRAHEHATMVTGHAVGHPVRCLRNPMAREFQALEQHGSTEEEILAFGAGKYRLAALEGDVMHGSVMAGQIAGLVHDVLPAAEVLRRTVAMAEQVIRTLDALVGDDHPQ